MTFSVRRFSTARAATTLLVVALLFAVLTVSARSANAQTDLTCTRSGDTLTWTETDVDVQVRGFRFATGDASSWLATVTSGDSSYEITDGDRFKAPGDRFFLRFRSNGVQERECTDVGEPRPPVSCTQSGTELTWVQPNVSVDGDNFFVRRVNPDGTTSFVAGVDETDAVTNSFSGVSADESYVIRYRISTSPADRDVFDVPCTGGATPPGPDAFSCVQDDGLQWTAVPDATDNGNGRYHVRRVNADGSTSWVQSTNQTAAPSTSNDSDFIIRYRVEDNAGSVFVIDQPCDPEIDPPTPGAVTCRTDRFAFGTIFGFDVILEGAEPGDRYSLIVDFEGVENNDAPLEVNEFTGIGPNTYFRQFGATGRVEVFLVGPDGQVPCGTVSVTVPPGL